MTTAPLCLYHAHCSDGLAAAWAVKSALPDAEFVPVRYGEPPVDPRGRDVIIVDFSYKREDLRVLAVTARSVLVLDHHKTAREELVGLMPPFTCWMDWMLYIKQNPELPAMSRVRATFDMERSGAGLAWDYFHPGEPRPWAIDRVEDRDLWRFKLDFSREVNAVIASYPDHDLDAFARVVYRGSWENARPYLLQEGEAILRKQLRDLENLLPLARRAIIRGFNVPILNCPLWLASEAGNRLSVGEPFSATYFDGSDKRGFSLRSQRGAVDVSAVAKLYGGGGHENAAGFSAELGWLGDAT